MSISAGNTYIHLHNFLSVYEYQRCRYDNQLHHATVFLVSVLDDAPSMSFPIPFRYIWGLASSISFEHTRLTLRALLYNASIANCILSISEFIVCLVNLNPQPLEVTKSGDYATKRALST